MSALFGAEQYHVGQFNIIWDRAVLCDTKQSHVGQISLIWDRVVSCGTEHSLVGQRSLIWNRVVLCGTRGFCLGQQSYKEERSLRRCNITFLMFNRYWNVLQVSKYFFIIFKILLDCQNVQNDFPEV